MKLKNLPNWFKLTTSAICLAIGWPVFYLGKWLVETATNIATEVQTSLKEPLE